MQRTSFVEKMDSSLRSDNVHRVILSEAKDPSSGTWQINMRTYYVYIMASKRNGTLYVGVTNDIERRVYEHKNKLVPGFTSKYNVSRLVYFEEQSQIRDAIMREKQIKGWLRRKKIALIETTNPNWDDLDSKWYERNTGSVILSESKDPSNRILDSSPGKKRPGSE